MNRSNVLSREATLPLSISYPFSMGLDSYSPFGKGTVIFAKKKKKKKMGEKIVVTHTHRLNDSHFMVKCYRC